MVEYWHNEAVQTWNDHVLWLFRSQVDNSEFVGLRLVIVRLHKKYFHLLSPNVMLFLSGGGGIALCRKMKEEHFQF